MAFDFDRVKQINQHTKDTVFGFIKYQFNIEIPQVILTICLLYFFDNACWVKHGKRMKLSTDQKTVTMCVDNPMGSKCYSSNWISISNKIVTTIRVKINHFKSLNNQIYIALSTSDRFVNGNQNLYCVYASDGSIQPNPNHKPLSNAYSFHGSTTSRLRKKFMSFKNGDIVMLTLSINGIKFFLNNQLQLDGTHGTEKFEFDTNQKYKVVVIMWHKEASVTLVDIVEKNKK